MYGNYSFWAWSINYSGLGFLEIDDVGYPQVKLLH